MVSSDLGCSSSLTFCNGRADWPYVSRPNTTRYEHIVCVLCAVLCCLCGEVLFLWLADFWGTRRRCRGVLPPPLPQVCRSAIDQSLETYTDPPWVERMTTMLYSMAGIQGLGDSGVNDDLGGGGGRISRQRRDQASAVREERMVI